METNTPTTSFSLNHRWMMITSFLILFFFLFLQNSLTAQNSLRVMKMGLGDGTVSSTAIGIDCGGDCDQDYASPTQVTLVATPDLFSTFEGWEGDVTSNNPSISVNVDQVRSIRAKFGMSTAINQIVDFTPEGIQTYLNNNLHVNTPAKFLKALPDEYKKNWILMTRSESLQTGTAQIPRIILPSADARFVFTIGLGISSSYPGSHPDAIEYMQWDATLKTFRMHEIVLQDIQPTGAVPYRNRGVSIDDTKCAKCHSTQNVLNRSRFRGTSPRGVIPKSKPNWDTYDSWGGMLAFNRDRIYQGSLEAASFRKLMNFWSWRSNAPVREVIEQLQLQPLQIQPSDSIARLSGGENDAQIWFAFDGLNNVVTNEPAPNGTSTINTNYNFDGVAGVGNTSNVQRDGTFVTLQHTLDKIDDEGRGVRLFDALGGAVGTMNQTRVADEIINHRFATGSFPIDIRPIALAIIKRKVSINADRVVSNVNGSPLTIDLDFFTNRIMRVDLLETDTGDRTKTLPRRKADIQNINLDRRNDPYSLLTDPLDGLIPEYGTTTSQGVDDDVERVRQEVFRRGLGAFRPDQSVMNGIYVDREDYIPNTEFVTLFRYFLEPLGMSVDEWSMNVRSRSLTYAFADIFPTYERILTSEIANSLRLNPIINTGSGIAFDPDSDSDLIAAVNQTLESLPNVNAVPTYTDIQRIFNKACIECHGGLRYPPYENYGRTLDFSENEYADGIGGNDRLKRSYDMAVSRTTNDPNTSALYQRLISPNQNLVPGGVMPMNGPALSKADIETVRRWIVGAPSRPYTLGDPHIGTVNGVSYDFQAAGEFTMLKAQNIEIQTRQTAIETTRPLGPNPHTGLTSCVSINTAFAMRMGGDRITFQPSGMGVDESEMQLRVNEELVSLTEQGFNISGGISITKSGGSGIQIQGQGNTIVVIPGWWSSQKLWFLNIDIRHVRASMGVMGEVLNGNWLPALPDGTELGPRPESIEERYNVLYNTFAEAWRVTDETSLFDYANGTSTSTFSLEGWPAQSGDSCVVPNTTVPIIPQPRIDRATAELRCGVIRADGKRENCIEDVMATGEVAFAETYIISDKIDQNKYPSAPKLLFPLDQTVELSLPIKFKWDKAKDEDGDFLKYKYYVWDVNEGIDNNKAVEAFKETTFSNNRTWIYILILIVIVILLFWSTTRLNGTAKRTRTSIAWLFLLVVAAYIWTTDEGDSVTESVANLETGKAYFWKVIVEDGNGGTVESETYRFEVK